jgi:hypothetical protein
MKTGPFSDIADLKDGDEVTEVRFSCGECGRIFDTIAVRKLNDTLIGVKICQTPCTCGKESGFNLWQGTTQERYAELRELCDVLTVNLKRPLTEDTRSRIRSVTRDRNLKLLFSLRPTQA